MRRVMKKYLMFLAVLFLVSQMAYAICVCGKGNTCRAGKCWPEGVIKACQGVEADTCCNGMTMIRPKKGTWSCPVLPVRCGDINSDQKVTNDDADRVLKASVRMFDPTCEQALRGDTNNDGRVDGADAVLIMRFVNGTNPYSSLKCNFSRGCRRAILVPAKTKSNTGDAYIQIEQ